MFSKPTTTWKKRTAEPKCAYAKTASKCCKKRNAPERRPIRRAEGACALREEAAQQGRTAGAWQGQSRAGATRTPTAVEAGRAAQATWQRNAIRRIAGGEASLLPARGHARKRGSGKASASDDSSRDLAPEFSRGQGRPSTAREALRRPYHKPCARDGARGRCLACATSGQGEGTTSRSVMLDPVGNCATFLGTFDLDGNEAVASRGSARFIRARHDSGSHRRSGRNGEREGSQRPGFVRAGNGALYRDRHRGCLRRYVCRERPGFVAGRR